MAFNPQEHLRDLKGQKYLDVKHRLVWLREEHPDARITTDLVTYREDQQMWVFKAEVVIPDHGTATGHGQETERDFPAGACEKAETKAIGRALAALGFGTAFAAEIDEGERVVDSPVQPARSTPTKAPAPENERQQALRLNTRITELCTALAIAPPQSAQDLASPGQSFGWPLAGTGAASVAWKEQLIVRLEGEQLTRQRTRVTAALAADPEAAAKLPKAADTMSAEELEKTLIWLQNRATRRAPVAEPEPVSEVASADTGPATSPAIGEPWTAPDVLNALAAASTVDDIESIGVAIIEAANDGAMDGDQARALTVCVDLGEAALRATSAGQLAQVEIDAKRDSANSEHYAAVIALTRRVRAMRGWVAANGATSRLSGGQPATAGAGAR